MELATITAIKGQVNEFYSRKLWSELIKAEASFTIEVDAPSKEKVANKIMVNNMMDYTPDSGDVERIMRWVNTWASTHWTSKMRLDIYSPLPAATRTKLERMLIGMSLKNACFESHVMLRFA